MPIILAPQEAGIRKIPVQSQLGQTTEKRAGGVTQEVQHVPSKSEALSSNSSTTKREKMICREI
jgi:hypothetical protein